MARAKLSLVAVALGACAHPRPAAGPPPPGAVVEVVDPGAAPRRALRYRPVRGLDHPVALTWGGGWRSSGASCLGAFDTRAQFDDVVLVGAVAGDLPADAALALRGGTTTHQDNPFVARHEIELRAVLPARYALVGDASAVTAAAGGDERLGQVVRAALPRFPRQAIGVGARWTVTEARDGGTRRVTWTLLAITGDRVTLAATIVRVAHRGRRVVQPRQRPGAEDQPVRQRTGEGERVGRAGRTVRVRRAQHTGAEAEKRRRRTLGQARQVASRTVEVLE